MIELVTASWVKTKSLDCRIKTSQTFDLWLIHELTAYIHYSEYSWQHSSFPHPAGLCAFGNKNFGIWILNEKQETVSLIKLSFSAAPINMVNTERLWELKFNTIMAFMFCHYPVNKVTNCYLVYLKEKLHTSTGH